MRPRACAGYAPRPHRSETLRVSKPAVQVRVGCPAGSGERLARKSPPQRLLSRRLAQRSSGRDRPGWGKSPVRGALTIANRSRRWPFLTPHGGLRAGNLPATPPPALLHTRTTEANTSRWPWARICARTTSPGEKGRRSQCRDRVVLLDARARARQPLLVADQGRCQGRSLRVVEAFYNRTRLHTTLGNHAPEEFERPHSLKQRKRLQVKPRCVHRSG